MKSRKKLKKAFGVNEFDLIDFPRKCSNVKISRIVNNEKMGGCSFCFPHGIETINSTAQKNTKSWKKNRLFQWRNH
ncbi:MAG: phosphate ABC transporter substrate-binding protein [Flavobacteriales bacterium]